MNPTTTKKGWAWYSLLLPAILLLALSGWLKPWDRKAFDASSRLLRTPSGERQVVLVGLDEGTERAFPEAFALWHHHLGAIFQALALAEPRAVGVDLTLPTRSFEASLPGGDAALLRGILLLRRACPLVLGVTVDAAGNPRPLHAPFLAAAGEGGAGFVQWMVDGDGVVRRFTEHPQDSRAWVPTFSGQVARQLGLPVQEGLLDYRTAPPVRYISMQQVEAWGREGKVDALRRAFHGRIVLLGSVLPFEDRHFQVADLNGWGEDNRGFAPGVLLHVQALENLAGRGLIREAPASVVVLLSLAMAMLGILLGARPVLGGLGVLASLVLAAWALLSFQGSGWFIPPSAPAVGLLLGFGTRLGRKVLKERRLAAHFARAFRGLVSPGVLRKIQDGTFHPGLDGEKVPLCILFSDVRGYTTLSEKRDPQEIIQVLNRYFEHMVPVIHAHGGTLDSFMGDGIMAHFGHPEPLDNPCLSAFEASRGMLQALDVLNQEFTAEGVPTLKIGIGLNHGEALVGYLGSKDRHEYTAIGDSVNVASRVEGLTKELGYPVVVTATVAARLAGIPGLAPLGPKSIKGHSDMEVFGWAPDPPGGSDILP